MLRERNATSASAPRRKRTRISVEPGRSVSTEDFYESDVATGNANQPSPPIAQENRDSDESEESTVPTFSQETSEFTGVFTVDESNIKQGDWLLVNFSPPASKLKAYLGRVESITRGGNRNFKASFLRHKSLRFCDKNLFVFPNEKDICAFSYQKVVGRVEAPEILRRGVLKFSVDSYQW